ncbi:MAG: hypothetical protein M1833_005478 [Piccolia ochrophora]|nr:MAG: hypothetical protein M1833_005478 [Piccolia ochrophora]
MDAPSQYKQPSRKGKKAWRKNVDLTNVQQGLDVVRDEVIRGGVIAEKAADELFTLDTAGDKTIKKRYNKIHKPLKADEILAERSAIPAVDSRKRPGSKTTDGVVEPSTKRRREGGLSYKELQRLKQLAHGGELAHKDIVPAPDAPNYDPWALHHLPSTQHDDPTFSFLDAPQPVREPRTLKHASISLAANGKDIPAVKRPEPETSYNPQSDAYFAAFVREGEKEVEAERQRLRDAEEERQHRERVARAAEEEAREAAAAAAAEENDDDDDESAWEGVESEAETAEWLARRRPERKTQAQRNKIKRRKEAERQRVREGHMQQRAQEVARIKQIAKTIDLQARSQKDLAQSTTPADDHDSESGDETRLRRRRLGKATIPARPLELVLPSELQDSLRLLKPEGNLLTDRFRSMLVRGKLETRRAITQPKKRQVVVTEKWSYKDWELK